MGSLKNKSRNDGSKYIEDSNNMTLEEYKKEVMYFLRKRVNEDIVQKLMEIFEGNFQQFMDWGYTPEVAANTMIASV